MEDDDATIFAGVRAYVSKSFPEPYGRQLAKVLAERKADIVDFNDNTLTHFVTDAIPTSESLEYIAPRKGLHFVTPAWIERTVVLGTRQEPAFYSAHPAMLFSGVVATACGLSRSDNDVMAAGISSLGGQWRNSLTKDVTHLFAMNENDPKYQIAMHFKDTVDMKVVVPHWFDDVVRLGIRNLPTEPYEWPDPRVFAGQAAQTLKTVGASSVVNTEDDRESRRARPPSAQKRALYDTIFQDTVNLPNHRPASTKIWEGLKIMFGSNIGFKQDQLRAHVTDVYRAGGEVVQYRTAEEELEKISQADVYIAQHRSGRGFVKAYKLNKTIGNLYWFWYVRITGILSRPTDQLLHYPIPRRPIEGFSRHSITVTNYGGKDREYIKKMLLILGVPFTATMSAKTTAVIAAYKSGEKTNKADLWGIPVVNHMWLEDCFAQWRDIDPAQDKYTAFPPGVNFGDLLAEDGGRAGLGLAGGTTAIGRVGYDQAELDRMELEIETEAAVLGSRAPADDEEAEKENEVAESPKHGILKKGRGAREDAAATARRLAAKRKLPAGDDDVDMDEVVNASTGIYVDMDVALDDDGRLSIGGSELGLEEEEVGEEDVDEAMSVDERGSSARPAGKAAVRPATPERGRRASASSSRAPGTPARPKMPVTPKSKATPPVQHRVSSRPRTRTDPVPPPPGDEDEDEDEDAETPSPVRPRRTPAKPVTTMFDDESEDEQSIQEAPRPGRVPTKRTAMMKGKAPQKAEDDFMSGSRAKKGTVIKTYHARSRSRSRSRSRARPQPADDDDYEAPAKPKSRGRPPASKARSSKADEDVETTSTRRRRSVSRGKAPATPKASTSRKRPQEVTVDTDDENEVVELTDEPAKPQTPHRRASVVLPTLAEVRSASQQRVASQEPVEKPVPSKVKTTRTGTLVVQANDAPEKSPPKRGRPVSTRSSKPVPAKEPSPPRSPSPSPPPPPKPKVARRSAAHVAAPAEAGPSRVDETPPTHARRSAATKAAQRLRDEIMPDVVSFQKELKSGHVKSAHEEPAAKGKGKEKASDAPSARGRKRPSLEGEDEQSSGDEHDKKKRKTETGVVAARAKRRKSEVQPQEEEEETQEEPKKRGRPAKAKAETQASDSRTDGKGIVIMTTQVTLSDDVTRTLTRLGVKFTTKPTECTHLVAKAIVRTEKFLCAMSVAPYVVTDKWVEACAIKRKILPEDDYHLKDPAIEKKYGFKLADALDRAKTHGQTLFKGLTFYVTPQVPAGTKLLKAVVTAGGGQLLTQSPTVRILKGHTNRFVISCPEDNSIWRPLAENGFTVYSQELIVTGMLKQQLEWDGFDVSKVAKSS